MYMALHLKQNYVSFLIKINRTTRFDPYLGVKQVQNRIIITHPSSAPVQPASHYTSPPSSLPVPRNFQSKNVNLITVLPPQRVIGATPSWWSHPHILHQHHQPTSSAFRWQRNSCAQPSERGFPLLIRHKKENFFVAVWCSVVVVVTRSLM